MSKGSLHNFLYEFIQAFELFHCPTFWTIIQKTHCQLNNDAAFVFLRRDNR